MSALIYTYTGKKVDLCNFTPNDVCIEDIAHALALCNRFAGHTKFPISVAQHSVYVSRLCESPLLGLLHDASEAYLGDVTRWLKHQAFMDVYRTVEFEIQSVIYGVFGISNELWRWYSSQRASLEAADNLMVRYEMMVGMGTTVDALNPDAAAKYPPLVDSDINRVRAVISSLPFIVDWDNWVWQHAEQAFLNEFRKLTEG